MMALYICIAAFWTRSRISGVRMMRFKLCSRAQPKGCITAAHVQYVTLVVQKAISESGAPSC